MTTNTAQETARNLIASRVRARQVKGGLARWMREAEALILKTTGKHFVGAAKCDSFVVAELEVIASA